MAKLSFPQKGTVVEEPGFVKWLLSSPKASWIWLILRVWLGYQWIEAGIEKVGNPGWVSTGEALKGFFVRAVAIPDAPARPAIAFDWYRIFLQFMIDSQSYVWFSKLVTYGEILVGIGLILGAFTGVAAFFGGLMNWNFMMAGSASTNPMLFLVAVALILAWKVAGYIGADYFLLPIIGTPWGRGKKQPAAPAPKRKAATS